MPRHSQGLTIDARRPLGREHSSANRLVGRTYPPAARFVNRGRACSPSAPTSFVTTNRLVCYLCWRPSACRRAGAGIMTLRSLAELSRRHGEEFGDSAALYADSRCLTYGELDLRSNQIAHALNAASGGTGRRVAFLGKNCAQYFVLLAACAKVGAVMVPLNWRLAYPEIAEIVIDAEAAVVIVDDEFEDFATRL